MKQSFTCVKATYCGIALMLASVGFCPTSYSQEVAKPATATANSEKKAVLIDIKGMPQEWLQGEPVTKWEKDRVYVLEFWATWCGPCIAAMPHIEQLSQKMKDKNISFIGVNVWDKKTPDELKEFLKKRDNPPTYPIVSDGEKGPAQKEWLVPQGVSGIPATFIVKNGELVWKGHPSQMNEEMLQSILDGKFVSAAASDSSKSKEMMKKRRADITDLLKQKEYKQATELLLKWGVDKDISPEESADLIRYIVSSSANAGQAKEAQSLLVDFMNKSQFNKASTLRMASWLLYNTYVPTSEKNFALIDQWFESALKDSDNQQKTSSIWGMLSDSKKDQGDLKAAQECMWKSLENSLPGKLFAEEKEKLGITQDFHSYIEQVIKPIWEKNAQSDESLNKEIAQWGETQKDNIFSPVFEQIDWAQGGPLDGLAKDKMTIIDFWIPPSPGAPTLDITSRGAAGMVKKVLKRHHLSEDKNIRVVTLIPNVGTSHDLIKQSAEHPDMKSFVPIGVAKTPAVWEDLMVKNGLKEAPTCLVAKDGILIWAGETKMMPSWVIKIIRENPSGEKLKKIVEDQVARNEKIKTIIFSYFRLNRDRKYDEAAKLVNEEIKNYPESAALANMCAEIKLADAVEKKDWDRFATIVNELLDQYPDDYSLAVDMNKYANSCSELGDKADLINMKAIEQLIRTELSSQADYDSYCNGILVRMYLKAGMMEKAKNALIQSLALSPITSSVFNLEKENK